jgi:hypothetical protein
MSIRPIGDTLLRIIAVKRQTESMVRRLASAKSRVVEFSWLAAETQSDRLRKIWMAEITRLEAVQDRLLNKARRLGVFIGHATRCA